MWGGRRLLAQRGSFARFHLPFFSLAAPCRVRPWTVTVVCASFVEKQFLLKMNREGSPGTRFLQAVDDGTEEALEFATVVSRASSADDRNRLLHHAVARLTQTLAYQCRYVGRLGVVSVMQHPWFAWATAGRPALLTVT